AAHTRRGSRGWMRRRSGIGYLEELHLGGWLVLAHTVVVRRADHVAGFPFVPAGPAGHKRFDLVGVCFRFRIVLEGVLRLAPNESRHYRQTDEVWQRHQAIEAIAAQPYYFEL